MKTQIREHNATALCCRRFQLDYSPEKLRGMYEEWLEAYQEGQEIRPLLTDIFLVYPMLIYLGAFKSDVHGNECVQTLHHYTCKHLDREAGYCTIYDIRPAICKNYPKWLCEYKDCVSRSFCNGVKREKLIEEKDVKKHEEEHKEKYIEDMTEHEMDEFIKEDMEQQETKHWNNLKKRKVQQILNRRVAEHINEDRKTPGVIREDVKLKFDKVIPEDMFQPDEMLGKK